MFYTPSFSIYGGVSGLYDYGPPGTAVKAALTQFWRQHFVFAESMLELECPSVTPEIVLKTSGHVDRFVDYSVQDELGNCIRADTLLKDYLEELMEDPKASAEDKKVGPCAGTCARISPVIPSTMLRMLWSVPVPLSTQCAAPSHTSACQVQSCSA